MHIITKRFSANGHSFIEAGEHENLTDDELVSAKLHNVLGAPKPENKKADRKPTANKAEKKDTANKSN